ncbi:serine/threonine-protein kinase [Erythrobacter sp. THAF29]|uniref:serine/threonine-protein kinase n=1 Tax=Erythrobacter sp. THAF29 TaxID=2587851 RepID=UPI001268FBB4|nr:serine/threonine-protein kinase [Erythrobacter sp. THAF29]QFT78696.1 Serine/threonine-protein kinase PknB [Erythrobacter sp. THAF29]
MIDAQLDVEAMALLERALMRPKETREKWIREQTDRSPEVLERAAILLKEMGSASSRISTGAPGEIDADAKAPERIGVYRIVQLLGRGGMGAVFKAERDAGDFEHVVAIKLVRSGILSPELVERFERERQLLAGLSHPGIARLYDGGTTEDGAPYIVMEFIDGVPIDKWVEQEKLDRRARIELMIAVCEAVSFAHQNLVIHRDLTPSNVLVTQDGVPKLIDFGIAKPQDDSGLEAQGSSLSQLSLTPGFAAPERYKGAPAMTLSDIYSLGKLLEAIVPGAGDDPDLSAMIARATAEEPGERYVTTNALATDLRKYLAGFPVNARPASNAVVARKFYERNRLPVIASIIGLMVLFGALLVAAGAYFRAESARAAEATRVVQLRELANYMLFDHNEDLAQVIGNGEARSDLVDKAQSYLLTLSELSEGDPSLKIDTAFGFIELARIQGVSAQPNFGEHDLAKANLDRAETLLKQAGGASTPQVAAGMARLNAYRALIQMHAESDMDAAQQAISSGLAQLDATPRAVRDAAWHTARSDIRRAQMEAADLEMAGGELGKLVDMFQSELDSWPSDLSKSERGEIDRALGQYYLATHFSYGEALDPARSLSEYRKSEQLFARFLKERPNEPYALYWRAWNAYYGHAVAAQNDDLPEASRMLDQAQETIAQLRLIEERDESLARFSELLREARADLDARMGRFDLAIAGQQAIVDERAAIAAEHPTSSRKSDLAYGHVVLADIARRAGRRNRACESYDEAEKYMGEVDDAGDLRGYVANLRSGVKANLARCNSGRGVATFTGTGEE